MTKGSDPADRQLQPTSHPNSRRSHQYCEQHRGYSGKWVLDWDYAKTAQYPTIGSMPKAVIANDAYRPTEEEPYRRATAFRWQDDHNSECPISRPMQDGLQEFCRVCERLDIDRIWVAGDSLSEGFSHSLRAQLGFHRQAYLKKLLQPFTINCTHTKTGDIYPIEHRFDRIDDNFTHGLFDDKLASDRQQFLTREL